MGDKPQASQDLLHEILRIKLDNDTKRIWVDQWVKSSASEDDQPPLVGRNEAQNVAHAGAPLSDNPHQLPLVSIKLVLLNLQSEGKQVEASPAAPVHFFEYCSSSVCGCIMFWQHAAVAVLGSSGFTQF